MTAEEARQFSIEGALKKEKMLKNTIILCIREHAEAGLTEMSFGPSFQYCIILDRVLIDWLKSLGYRCTIHNQDYKNYNVTVDWS